MHVVLNVFKVTVKRPEQCQLTWYGSPFHVFVPLKHIQQHSQLINLLFLFTSLNRYLLVGFNISLVLTFPLNPFVPSHTKRKKIGPNFFIPPQKRKSSLALPKLKLRGLISPAPNSSSRINFNWFYIINLHWFFLP